VHTDSVCIRYRHFIVADNEVPISNASPQILILMLLNLPLIDLFNISAWNFGWVCTMYDTYVILALEPGLR